ncbi:MAG: Rab family GTPase [Candidatus Thorarchaeota archaeon]
MSKKKKIKKKKLLDDNFIKALEKRLRNLETEKQLLDAERLRLEQILHSLREEFDRLRDMNGRKSPIWRLMQLVPVNIRNLFGKILEKLMLIMLNTRDLGEQNLRDVKSSFSTLLEEIEALRKMIQEPRKKPLKWYELCSGKASSHQVSNIIAEKEEKKKNDYAFKIIVLGKPEKTAFILKFATEIFIEEIRYAIGADVFIKNVEIEGINVTLRIWDFAAEERFRFLLPQYIRDTNGAIIMYDAIDAKILKNVSEVLEIVKKNVGEIPIFLALPEIPSKAEEHVDLTRKYTFTEITSEVGPTGERAFELLMKKMLEREQIE